jgi:indole-3-glycerol phosphate synthase
MTDRLAPILAAKRRLVERRRIETPVEILQEKIAGLPAPRGFLKALRSRQQAGRYALIAEMKRASPSKGLIRSAFDAAELGRAYQAGGAACLSVLTDEFFQACDEDLLAASSTTSVPILRKDFMVDPYQLYESRALGADCILLIMAALTDVEATHLITLAQSLGLDALVETHDAEEIDRAVRIGARMIGINNRNLKNLQVDLDTSRRLVERIPSPILKVAESGLSKPSELALLAEMGVSCFLVGESLLKQPDVEHAVRSLIVDRP